MRVLLHLIGFFLRLFTHLGINVKNQALKPIVLTCIFK